LTKRSVEITHLILNEKDWRLLVESMLLFENESGVDGEGEVCDRVEDVEDEDEHHGEADLVGHV